jgi:hypothetical protein
MAEASKKKGEIPLSSRMMPHDITTRWNYTYNMLSFAYTYREAFNELTSNREMNMRKYELSDAEWRIVNDLASVLKVSGRFSDVLMFILLLQQIFCDATLFFSCSTPNLAKVIPAMDLIDRHLATSARNQKYDRSIQAALAIGKKLLNKYYNVTDHSELYRIAMGKFKLLVQNVIYLSSSTSSEPQTRVLQDCRMGRRLGQDGGGNRMRRV